MVLIELKYFYYREFVHGEKTALINILPSTIVLTYVDLKEIQILNKFTKPEHI